MKDIPLFDIMLLEQTAQKEVRFTFEGQEVVITLEHDAPSRPYGPAEEAVVTWLTDVIAEWNLARGQKRLPVKRKVIRSLPGDLREAIRKHVYEALNPSSSIVSPNASGNKGNRVANAS